MYLSKGSVDSLLESVFRDDSSLNGIIDPFEVSVEDMEEIIEGYENAFDERAKVKVSFILDKIHSVQFDQTFTNIPFRADARVIFSNPIDERFSSAMV